LKAYAAWAADTGQVEGNPISAVRGVAEQKHAPKWLDRRAQARLMRELEKTVTNAHTEPAKLKAARNLALVRLLLNTGLRVSELCALEMDDIPQLGERSGRLVVREGKGCKRREMPLNADARRALSAWLKVRPQSELSAVFVGRRGEPLTKSGINRLLDEYDRRADVEVSPHTLHHSFAKNLVDAGISLDRVAALTGHAKLETTRLYTLPGERDLELAVEAVET
jgi:site-specific recombinase XerD